MPPSQDPITSYINTYLTNLQHLKVSEESVQYIREKLQVVRVKSKGTLIMPGDVCRHIYVVVQGGFVCRYIHEKTGAAKTINFYLETLHPIMASLDSYFTQVPTNCELKAITDSVVVAFLKKDIDTLVKQDPHFASFYHNIVITAMVEENELKTKLIAYSAKEKYEFIIQEMPSVIQQVPSKYIAEFCGISSEWLSKLKRQE